MQPIRGGAFAVRDCRGVGVHFQRRPVMIRLHRPSDVGIATDTSLLAFVAVAVAVAVTPGPDMLLVMRNTIGGGRRAGLATVLGVILGVLTWSVLAVAGIAAVLAASAVAFTILKLAGAAYLIYLGIRALLVRDERWSGQVPSAHSPGEAAVQGFLSAALNPKLGVFFLTLLPQFTDPQAAPWRSLELVAVFAVIGLVWLVAFTMILGTLAAALPRPRLRRAVQRATGVMFIALGVRVAFADR